jgi:hypothetical protein
MCNNNIVPTNPNTTIFTITFNSPWLLQQKLIDHDRRHQTNFYDLSNKYKIHQELGDKTHNYEKAISFIKRCLEKENPSLQEYKIIEQKTALMKALDGKLNTAAAKL